MSKDLHLNVHRLWFDLIAQGYKTKDYRAMSDYWYGRLWESLNKPKPYDRVIISNGYSPNAPRLICQYLGVELTHAQTLVTYKGGFQLIPGSSYAILIGKILELKNWDGPRDHKPGRRPIFLKDLNDKKPCMTNQ